MNTILLTNPLGGILLIGETEDSRWKVMIDEVGTARAEIIGIWYTPEGHKIPVEYTAVMKEELGMENLYLNQLLPDIKGAIDLGQLCAEAINLFDQSWLKAI